MKVRLERDSVCAGDDTGTAHEIVVDLQTDAPLPSLLDAAASHVPGMGNSACWVLVAMTDEKRVPVCVMSGDSKSRDILPQSRNHIPMANTLYRMFYRAWDSAEAVYRNLSQNEMHIYRWSGLMDRLGIFYLGGMFEQLQNLHAQRHRHYHTAAHISAMLRHLDRHVGLAKRPDLIEVAIWFHDAVYKPMSQTNERDSADMAVAFLSGHLPRADVDKVETMILLTQTHGDTADPDTALMLDIDLSVLAAAPDVYERYTHDIRREYRFVPAPLYRKGRVKVLRHFLDMPRIYKTDALAELWEQAARENLAAELETL